MSEWYKYPNSEDKRFAGIPAYVLCRPQFSNLGGREVQTLCFMMTFLKEDKTVSIGAEYIANKLSSPKKRVHRQTINIAIKEMCNNPRKKLFERVRKGRHNGHGDSIVSVYRLKESSELDKEYHFYQCNESVALQDSNAMKTPLPMQQFAPYQCNESVAIPTPNPLRGIEEKVIVSNTLHDSNSASSSESKDIEGSNGSNPRHVFALEKYAVQIIDAGYDTGNENDVLAWADCDPSFEQAFADWQATP